MEGGKGREREKRGRVEKAENLEDLNKRQKIGGEKRREDVKSKRYGINEGRRDGRAEK